MAELIAHSAHPSPPGDGPRPLVAVPACRKLIHPHPFHAAGEKYLGALVSAADVMPVVVPAMGGARVLRDLIGRIDGLFLTGSPSNVEPHHYGGAASAPDTHHDPHRDATTLPLISTALAAGLPILAVCRGAQELNVALGGTLHQKLQEVAGKLDHRARDADPLEVQYGPAHAIDLTPGGWLAEMAGATRVMVNSLHAQGVDRLAGEAVVEATAEDGVVEAFRVEGHGPFVLAVQWHPEWRVLDNPLSTSIFRRFGEACRAAGAGARDEPHRAVV